MRLLCIWLMFATACFAADNPSGPIPERIDVNNAPQETLEKLPGVGPKLAKEIIAGRPFRVIDDLNRVKGIGDKKLAQLRPRVVILPMRATSPNLAPPAADHTEKIDLNKATQAELESLPGIGPKKAEAIIAKRPFKQPGDLLKVPGIKRAQFDKIKDLVQVR